MLALFLFYREKLQFKKNHANIPKCSVCLTIVLLTSRVEKKSGDKSHEHIEDPKERPFEC